MKPTLARILGKAIGLKKAELPKGVTLQDNFFILKFVDEGGEERSRLK